MAMPFPGMDPYLEHPTLWTGVHSRLINAISSQIAPALRPRYVVSIEERVVMELSCDPIREPYIEILDRYHDLQVVTVLELLSPINKAAGPGRDQYLKKRSETLNSSTHLVEIDLLRNGARACDFNAAQLSALGAFDYLIEINRSQGFQHEASRTRFEFIRRRLREPLPTFGLPLVSPDPDVALDLQAALDRVYEEGSYTLRIDYGQPCLPTLGSDDQQWVGERWAAYRAAHTELFR